MRPVTAVTSNCSLSMGNHASLCFMYPFTIRATKPFQEASVASETGLAAQNIACYVRGSCARCCPGTLTEVQAFAADVHCAYPTKSNWQPTAYLSTICVYFWPWSGSSRPCTRIASSLPCRWSAMHATSIIEVK